MPREAVQRWRLVIARDGREGEAAQRAQLAAWEATLAGSGLPVAGLDLATPKARFALAAPLAAGIPGEAELVDVWLVERAPTWRVREALADRLPPGHRLAGLYDVWLGEPPLPGQVVASVFRAELSSAVDARAAAAAAAAMLEAAALPRRRRKGDTVVPYDLRPFLDALTIAPTRDPDALVVRMTLRHDPERGIGRPDEVLAELGERLGSPLVPASLVRERLVLAGDPPTTALASRGRR